MARAPIGLKIRNERKKKGLTQVALAKLIAISPSYLNLIESNKRDVGGALIIRAAAALEVELDALSGESEQRMVHDLAELAAHPDLAADPQTAVSLSEGRALDFVGDHPEWARALIHLFRKNQAAEAKMRALTETMHHDPLVSDAVLQMLSHITVIRSNIEILNDVEDMSTQEQHGFFGTINSESELLGSAMRTLVTFFDHDKASLQTASPAQEVDDMIIAEQNFFPRAEEAARTYANRVFGHGQIAESALIEELTGNHNIKIDYATVPPRGLSAYRIQTLFDQANRTLRFIGNVNAATRRFQMARLLCELCLPDAIDEMVDDARLTSDEARAIGRNAMSSYCAGALLFPYDAFLASAKSTRYDIDALCQLHTGSFEQIAHRLVTLKRSDARGIPFAFLRADPSGRLTKRFPLANLALPSIGYACPLWTIYAAQRTPETVIRNLVEFPDNSRFLFIAKSSAKRAGAFMDPPLVSSIMLACDVLHADETVYGEGLDTHTPQNFLKIGATCRLCPRRQCLHRQEKSIIG